MPIGNCCSSGCKLIPVLKKVNFSKKYFAACGGL
jgi:hypothetical protein